MQLVDELVVSLDKIKFFVLDEADRMLDMGFKKDIDRIIKRNYSNMPTVEHRQTIMFSATFREDLRRLASVSLKKDYRLVEAGEINSAQPDVEQKFHLFEDRNDVEMEAEKLSILQQIILDLLLEGEKTFNSHFCWKEEYGNKSTPDLRDYLLHMLGSCSEKKIIVFVETKRAAKEIAYWVSEFLYDHFSEKFMEEFSGSDILGVGDNFGAIYMNGTLRQRDRRMHLNLFKDGLYPIMVSTNLLARGIDVEGVTHVINFDMPKDLKNVKEIRDSDKRSLAAGEIGKIPKRDQFEEYIHRIGRTGRAGNAGKSISFFRRDRDNHLAIDLVIML